MLNVEVRADRLEVAAQRLDPLPGGAVPIERSARIGPASHVPIAVDRLVVLFLPAEILGQHVSAPALPQMVLAPVDSIEIEVNKPAMGVQVAHVEHRVIGEPVRHIEPALVHVVRAGAQLDMIEDLHRRDAVAVPVKERIAKL